MRTIWIIPGMFGLNVEFTFGSTKSGNNTSLASFTEKTWTKVTAAAARWQQRRALKELPNYLLKDVGLSHWDVVEECNKPFWR
ncbi:DUF1127 domain-containing protein [Curvivirga sp.]|uniref:DUF1127 domain-containing protein n=1 Tax=Curvivirga sp. TaxID=2856848 RepID=UPI003B5AE64A